MAKEYLIVDGYNIIYSWNELKELAHENLEAARYKLADILCNYQGYCKNEVILIFDAYQSKATTERVVQYNNIDIVYTKEGETADQWIESLAQGMARTYNIRVATSDGLEQILVLGKGAARVSARELKKEIEEVEKAIAETFERKIEKKRNSIMDNLSPEMAQLLEQMRLNED